ncbi:MAG: helix-turn-helix domain-containing protein [Bacteroidia bacterium]
MGNRAVISGMDYSPYLREALSQFLGSISERFSPGRQVIQLHVEPVESYECDESEPSEEELNESITLPKDVFELLTKLVIQGAEQTFYLNQGIPEQLTTQEAADLLKVSSPFVIKLLETGKIPFHKVGKHRRITRADFISYRDSLRAQRQTSLEKLAKQAQDLDMGYE